MCVYKSNSLKKMNCLLLPPQDDASGAHKIQAQKYGQAHFAWKHMRNTNIGRLAAVNLQ